MTIDAEMLSYYAKVAAAFPDTAGTADPLAIRQQFAEVAKAFSSLRPDGVRVEALVIPLDGRELRARVYRPDVTAGAGALPLIVYLHGGGWVVGDLETHDLMVARMARDAACAIVSVDYRMAPEAPFPAPAHDARDALIWLAEHRARMGFATDRLGVAGDSAGGHLAAYAARAANDRVAGLVSAQLLLYPVARHAFNSPSHLANANGPGLTLDEMRWYWAAFLADSAPAADDVRAFPLAQPYDRPPARTLIVAAAYDVLYDDAIEFAKFIEANGGRAELIDATDMTHGFGRVQAHSRAAAAWMKAASERFGAWLREPK